MPDIFHNEHTILVGDCLERMRELTTDSIDIAIFSPPYNLNIAYNSYSDDLPRDRYLLWMHDVAISISRLMKPTASLFLNIGSSNIDPWVSMDVGMVFRKIFKLQNHIIWVKSISIGDDTIGHFKPINSNRYLNHNHESIFHFTKTGNVPLKRLDVGVPFKDKSNISRRGHAQDRRCAGNTWFIPYETVQSKTQKFNHPAVFPVALVKRCIKLHGGGVVFDPFLGSGTTLVAAQELGYTGIGIELDMTYATNAANRLRADSQ